MPRSRNIKPAFFKNEELAELDHGGRLLFIGLWCLADRNGLIDYRPKRIKIELFPYDPDIDVNGYITVMGRLGLIQLLTDGESDWLYIPTFTKHQNPHHTEKTAYPDPNSLKLKEEKDLPVTSPLSNVRNLADSCSLNPDSLNPDSLTLIPERGTLKPDMSSDLDVSSILDYLNVKTGKSFKPVESNLKLIRARLTEGHTEAEVLGVIDLKFEEWANDDRNRMYLRPATLFNAEKFNQYVGELGVETPGQKHTRELDEWANGTVIDGERV